MRLLLSLALASQLLFLTSCFKKSSDFKWGYRTCHIDSQECLEYSAAFPSKEDCDKYIERHSLRCLEGEYLRGAQLDQPVCWKTEQTLSRSKCNEM